MAPQVYLEDFVVCCPPEEWLVDAHRVQEMYVGENRWQGVGNEAIAAFGWKVHNLVGMSPTRTYLPPWINPQHTASPETGTDRAYDEAMVTVLGTAEQLLQKTGLKACDIDILVTACSVYCPTPSLSAMLVNKLGMRPDVISYSLGGMGCSSGVLGLQLTSELLQLYQGKRALFVAAEITTVACYTGKDIPRYLANTLFRAGGAAALLTSKPSSATTANYRLLATTRSHDAMNEQAYRAVHFGPDAEGINGLLLSKDLPKHAGKVLERCVGQIAPKIMTWSQYADAAAFYLQKAAKRGLSSLVSSSKASEERSSNYVPEFTSCIQHFALHAGGYVVVKAIQQGMRLPPEAVMPSMATLRDFGNTSVSVTWYAWAYCEAVQHVQRGQRVLQLGVGSGVKGAVIAWEALRDVPLNSHPAWAHLKGKRYEDADLPRSLMEEPQTDAYLAGKLSSKT